MTTPHEIRKGVQHRLALSAHGKLLALSIVPAVRDETSIGWHGRFIAANKRGVVLGAWCWRADGRAELSGVVTYFNSTDDDGAVVVDGDVIERALMQEALWWVPSSWDGVRRPCGMMARRVQYMAEQLTK